MSNNMLDNALTNLDATMTRMGYAVDTENIKDIICKHAMIAAGSGALVSVAPGGAALVGAAAAIASVTTMYVRLSRELNVHLGKDVLKSIATTVVADTAGTVVAYVTTATILSFFPGIGTAGAVVLSAIANYSYIYIASIVFIKMLSALMCKGKMPASISADDVIAAAHAVAGQLDTRAIMREAKESYAANK